jgi:DNA-binding XRE family transcriptional regulator
MELSKKEFRKDLDVQERTIKEVENEKNDMILKLK